MQFVHRSYVPLFAAPPSAGSIEVDVSSCFMYFMKPELALMMLFISSSKPTSRIRSASSMIRDRKFLKMKPGVLCR
jgi:hypothetical protein